MTRFHLLTSLVLLAPACSDNLAAPPPGATPRTIRGTASLISIDEAGHSTTFPIGLHDTLVSAQFPSGDGWDVREGTASDDGTFTVEDAADGAYWLEVEDVPSGARQLLWTDASVLSFEQRANGRGDAQAAGPGTTLTFDLDGLDPQGDNSIELAAGNLGLSANLIGVVQPGAASVHTTRGWAGNPLISTAAHDDVIFAQSRDAIDAATGVEISSIVAAATVDTIEQTDGGDTHVTATLTTPPALAYDLRWARSQFAAAGVDIHPTRVGPPSGQNAIVQAMPGGVANGTSPLSPVVLAIISQLDGADDLDTHFAVTNPFPADWLFTDVSIGFPVVIPVPGDPSQQVEFGSAMRVITNVLPDADHPIVPLVTPPTHPMIAGLDMFTDHDGVGLTPMIAWSPPAHGAPTAYVISVQRWLIQPGFSAPLAVATLVVPGDVTQVRMPDRILAPGEHYLLVIGAISQAGQDVRVHSLYTLGVPYGYAEMFGNSFAP